MVDRIDKDSYFKNQANLDSYDYFSPYREYLNSFTKEELSILDSIFPKIDNYLIFGDKELLCKLGIHFLRTHRKEKGNVNCKYKNYGFGHFVDGCYNTDYEEASHYKNCQIPLLVIYISKSSGNIKNERYISTAFENRYYSKLPSIILSEVIPKSLPTLINLPFMNCYDFRGNGVKDLRNKLLKINKNDYKIPEDDLKNKDGISEISGKKTTDKNGGGIGC